MDWAVMIARVVGVDLLAATGRSIYKHFRSRAKAKAAGQVDQQAGSERFLNGVLLYAWYLFALAFSTGLIVNN
jgi:hypothetical protein